MRTRQAGDRAARHGSQAKNLTAPCSPHHARQRRSQHSHVLCLLKLGRVAAAQACQRQAALQRIRLALCDAQGSMSARAEQDLHSFRVQAAAPQAAGGEAAVTAAAPCWVPQPARAPMAPAAPWGPAARWPTSTATRSAAQRCEAIVAVSGVHALAADTCGCGVEGTDCSGSSRGATLRAAFHRQHAAGRGSALALSHSWSSGTLPARSQALPESHNAAAPAAQPQKSADRCAAPSAAPGAS